MNLKSRIKSYKFWVALSSAVVIFVNTLGKVFNFEIPPEVIEGVIMAFCGVLVVFGVVEKPKQSDKTDEKINQENYEN